MSLVPYDERMNEVHGLFGLGFGVMILFGIIIFLIWIWSLIHCIKNPYLSDNNRIIGVVLIVILGIIGSLVYLFLPRESSPQR